VPEGFLDTGTTLKSPNFAAMAKSIGVRGIRLEDPGDVESVVLPKRSLMTDQS
jgi:thiamine pyrophosphate-dependent acetolactate synthase large subunit-like protein